MDRRSFMFGGTVLIGSGGGLGGYISVNTYAANDGLLAYTDCVAPSYVNGYARFQRPLTDDYTYSMPGARLRFRSNAKIVNVMLRYNGLVTRSDARNTIGHVYIDGVFSANFTGPYAIDVTGVHRVNIVNGSASDRLYEIILPYADGLEFGGVEVDAPYVVTAAAARTGDLMVCFGDSITQGFSATDTRRSWPFLLGEAKGYRCLNMGFGGRATIAADGTVLGGMGADLITVLIGYNDFAAQTALATFKANFKSLLTNINAVDPTVPVYVATPIVSATVLGIPLSSYRTQITAGISELAFAQVTSVDGSALCSIGNLADGVHPNDTGSAEMATNWAAIV